VKSQHCSIFVTPLCNTHNRFTALLEFVWDYPGEQVPERTRKVRPIWVYWSKR